MKWMNKYEAQEFAENWVEMVVNKGRTITAEEFCKAEGISLTKKQITKVLNYAESVIEGHEKIEVVVGEGYERDTNAYYDIYEDVPCAWALEVDEDRICYDKERAAEWWADEQNDIEGRREAAMIDDYEDRMLRAEMGC